MTKLQEINFSGSLNFGQSLQQTIRMFSQQKKRFCFFKRYLKATPNLICLWSTMYALQDG